MTDCRITAEMMLVGTAVTLDELIERLAQLRASHPECAARPVVLTVMDEGDGVLTHVEVDCFDERQGRVASLLSWATR